MNLSAIILTYNEELHLGECLGSLKDFADQIFVVDSYSTDRTVEIATNYGAEVIQHPFENQAQQFNWALYTLQIKNDWILRLDADEYVTEALKLEIAQVLPAVPQDISGFFIKRRVYFMNRFIKHGGYYPTWLLRLFRKSAGRSEHRGMDEHIVLLRGHAVKLKNDFVHDNKRDLTDWTNKHNQYSTREVADVLDLEQGNRGARVRLGGQPARKRWFKEHVYLQLPLFVRPALYFFYRYVVRLGFLDGKEGLIFHFLQGFWYRFLVDAKIYEKRIILKKRLK